MLDIKYIREHSDLVRDAIQKKRRDVDLDTFLSLDDQRKDLQHQMDVLKSEQKQAGKERNIEKATSLKSDIQSLQTTYDEVKSQFDALMLQIPQILHADVPDGASDADNVEVKAVGAIPSFDFEPKDHVTLMMEHDMIDIERAVKLSGARNYFLKGDGALLEQAVLQYAFQKIVSKGFVPMAVPQMVDPSCLVGTGYFPGGEDDTYQIESDDKRLIATAEIPLTAYHSGEILDEAELPKQYV
jgi:seryl-tRNA synthetase